MMDETFIQMCREAKEIQEGWEPKPADKVVLVRLDDNPYGLKGTYHLDYLDKDAKDWSNEDLHNEGIYWLPLQEDLQTIYDNHVGLTFDLVLMAFQYYYENEYEFESNFSMVWLCFVMETCYGKQWNMETQTWEAIQ